MAGIDATRFQEQPPTPPRPNYGDPAYWTARYANTMEPYDWYVRWEQLQALLAPLLTPESQILVLGCGTSLVTEALFTGGFVNITAVDQCEGLIEHLKEQHEAKETVKFEALNVEKLPEDWAGSFNMALDKATLDSILCQAPAKGSAQATEVLKAVSASLAPGGRYVCVSHAKPEHRLPLLLGPGADKETDTSQIFDWKISCHTIPRPMSNSQPTAPAAAGKGKAPAAKSAEPATELVPGPAFVAADDVYHIYICERPTPPPPSEPPEEPQEAEEAQGEAAEAEAAAAA